MEDTARKDCHKKIDINALLNLCIQGNVSNTNFDTTQSYGWYYDQLSEISKKSYVILLKSLFMLEDSIALPYQNIDEMSKIFYSVLKDNTLIFFDRTFEQSYVEGETICYITPEYTFSKSTIVKNMQIVKNYLQRFDSLKNESDYNKVRCVHDYCIINFKYDYAKGPNAYSILGLILNNVAVCEGISEFFKLVLDYLGVRSIYVVGSSKNPNNSAIINTSENHAWNIVYVDKKPFHFDVTWDICMTDNIRRYDYFMLSDDDIKKDHIIDRNTIACDTKGKDFYTNNSLVAYSFTDLEKIVETKLRKGERIVVLKLSNMIITNDIVDKVIKRSLDIYSKIEQKKVFIKSSYNKDQGVFQMNFSTKEDNLHNKYIDKGDTNMSLEKDKWNLSDDQTIEKDGHTKKSDVTPFYLVLDASSSMFDDDKGNELPYEESPFFQGIKFFDELYDAMVDNVGLQARLRVGAIIFGSTAKTELHLSNVSQLKTYVEQSVGKKINHLGQTKYGLAFDQLRTQMKSDLELLEKEGKVPSRPIAIFLTDGEPCGETENTREEAYKKLTEETPPNILCIGVGNAKKDTLVKYGAGRRGFTEYTIANENMVWVLSGGDLAQQITKAIAVMVESLNKPGGAVDPLEQILKELEKAAEAEKK